MRVFKNTAGFKKDSKRPIVLALGNFDGIHLGHQKLLNYVVSQSRKFHGRAAVFTFREHPQAVLHPAHAPESLQSLDQKLNLFDTHGIEVCFLQHFDRKFSALSAAEFVEKILVKKLGIREICFGYNARFGKGRQGDADLLRTLGKKFGFDVFQAKPVVKRGAPISSTVVRKAVHEGKMDLAASLLGRPWSIEGIVKRGAARGKKLGYPTANMDLNNYARPAFGVYAVRMGQHQGVANFGLRPTFGKNSEPVLETHLFNFKKNIYGKRIQISFIKHLRCEKKFISADTLKQQIEKDIQMAKKIFKQRGSR